MSYSFIFSFCGLYFCVLTKQTLPKPRSQTVSFMFSSRRFFLVFAFTFRSMIYFWMWCQVRVSFLLLLLLLLFWLLFVVGFFFWHKDVQSFQLHLLKRPFFYTLGVKKKLHWVALWKIGYISVGLFPDFLFCTMCLSILSLMP